MASIKQVKEKYAVQIRKKNQCLNATFANKQTADLWIAYKESLIEEIINFDVPLIDLMTFETAVDMKISRCQQENKDKKYISDFLSLKADFIEFLNSPISSIKYEDWMKKSNEMSTTIVMRGGKKINQSGEKRIQSLSTILRKIRCCSAVYSMMIENGINIENHPLKISQYLSTLKKSSPDKIQDLK